VFLLSLGNEKEVQNFSPTKLDTCGHSWTELDTLGQNWTELDTLGQNWTELDWTQLDKTGHLGGNFLFEADLGLLG
jgi:hypothetical protein